MAGYPQQAPGPTQQTVQWFQAVDQDRSGHINALELQRALVNGNMSQFSEEACRMMIDMFDKDRSGTIDVREFGQLFDYIGQWRGVFQGFDRDRSIQRPVPVFLELSFCSWKCPAFPVPPRATLFFLELSCYNCPNKQTSKM